MISSSCSWITLEDRLVRINFSVVHTAHDAVAARNEITGEKSAELLIKRIELLMAEGSSDPVFSEVLIDLYSRCPNVVLAA